MTTRGQFIVFEGLDRSGKTTQSTLLYEALKKKNQPVELWRFPNRSTPVGRILDDYLKNKENTCHPKTAHLLFAANRWETHLLLAGTTVLCDRYAFSGVAYSTGALRFDMDWCLNPDMGLIAPDLVLFLKSRTNKNMLAHRGSDGELYEKEELQANIANAFEKLRLLFTGNGGRWEELDADATINEMANKILGIVDTESCVKGSEPLKQLWTNEDVV